MRRLQTSIGTSLIRKKEKRNIFFAACWNLKCMLQPREKKHQTKILFFVSTWNVGYIWLQRGIRTRTIYIWVWHQDLRDPPASHKLVKIHIVKHTQWKGLIKHGYVYVESVYLQSMILFEQNLKWNKSCDVETCMIHTLTRPRAIYQIGLVLVRYPQNCGDQKSSLSLPDLQFTHAKL